MVEAKPKSYKERMREARAAVRADSKHRSLRGSDYERYCAVTLTPRSICALRLRREHWSNWLTNDN